MTGSILRIDEYLQHVSPCTRTPTRFCIRPRYFNDIGREARRGITRTLQAMIKRCSAIEPTIGHMKLDGRLGCNPLQGALGDALRVVLCGAGCVMRVESPGVIPPRRGLSDFLCSRRGMTCPRRRSRPIVSSQSVRRGGQVTVILAGTSLKPLFVQNRELVHRQFPVM